jgi:hypothetical protein
MTKLEGADSGCSGVLGFYSKGRSGISYLSIYKKNLIFGLILVELCFHGDTTGVLQHWTGSEGLVARFRLLHHMAWIFTGVVEGFFS